MRLAVQVLCASLSLGLCLGGCSKPPPRTKSVPKTKQPPPPGNLKGWRKLADNYNEKAVEPGVIRPKIQPKVAQTEQTIKPLTLEELTEQHTNRVRLIMQLTREIQERVAVQQVGEMAALALSIQDLPRITKLLEVEMAFAQQRQAQLITWAEEVEQWARLVQPRAKKQDADRLLNPKLVKGISELGEAVTSYYREVGGFVAFLQLHWPEFAVVNGLRSIRRAAFTPEYSKAANKLITARKRYESAVQQMEILTK